MYRHFQSVTTISTVILALVLITVVLAGTLITTTAAYSSSTSNFNNTAAVTVPTAESVYQLESMKLPPSVGSFIILIANEAHESWQDERHKLITE